MACFCKLMAQNWHKSFALVQACSGFTRRVSDCEELVGAITGDDGVCFYGVSFFKRIGVARTKLMGIEENDNGQGNICMVCWWHKIYGNGK